MRKKFTVGRVLELMREPLQLDLLSDDAGLAREILTSEVSSPGLVLAGYVDRFPAHRVLVFGETEMTYLASLSPTRRRKVMDLFFSFEVPCVVVTKGQSVPEEMMQASRHRGVPILRSALKTAEFFARVKPAIAEEFSPTTTLHGSLADVYGVGLLFVGQSGIGKSECVLDLVERGHRLVADDLVIATRRGHDIIIGRGHELQRHHMEIRGVGLVDVPAIFGIRSVRLQKRIEVIVKLEAWDKADALDRTGLDETTTNILDVQIPTAVIPLNPGKNITVVSEVVAMMHLLRYSGVDVAAAFNERLIKKMREKRGVREYLRGDIE